MFVNLFVSFNIFTISIAFFIALISISFQLYTNRKKPIPKIKKNVESKKEDKEIASKLDQVEVEKYVQKNMLKNFTKKAEENGFIETSEVPKILQK